MKHVMHLHSLEAYSGEIEKFRGREAAILSNVVAMGPGTDRAIAKRMGFDHRSEVQPRISELINKGWLAEVAQVPCSVTSKTVRVVGVPTFADHQMTLFEEDNHAS